MINIDKVFKFAEKFFLKNKEAEHGMDHVMRVYNMAIRLAEGEKVDLEVVKIATILHDIGKGRESKDHTRKTDHAIESTKIAKPFLIKLKLDDKKINHILDCIISHRHRTDSKPKTLEAKIVYDADKLDSIGAVGVARAYAWTGRNNCYIYRKVNIKEYIQENMGGNVKGKIIDKTKHSHQIEWEIKNKHAAKFMYTKKAKEIARKRIEYHKGFLLKLEREVKGLE